MTSSVPPGATKEASARAASGSSNAGSLQRVKLVHEIEGAAPVLGGRKEVGDAIGDSALRKAAPRPLDCLRDEIESGDARACRGERFGVIAEAAADVERALILERSPGEPLREQGMRREVSPRHARRIVAGKLIDRLEPRDAARIRLNAAGPLGRIEGVQPLPGPRAPFGEVVRHVLSSLGYLGSLGSRAFISQPPASVC